MSEDILTDYLTEGREILDVLDALLEGLEKSPGAQDLAKDVMRGFHTIKGNSLALDYPRTAVLAASCEKFMRLAISRGAEVGPAPRLALARASGALRKVLARIETGSGEEGSELGEALKSMETLLAKQLRSERWGKY